MFSRVPIILATLVLCAAGSALALGGQDILIDDVGLTWPDLRDIVATEDGILFAIGVGNADETLMHVYRSDDGGTRWTLWSEIEPVNAEAEFNEAHLEVNGAVPGSLLIVWTERSFDGPVTGSWLQFGRAPVVDENPSWAVQELDYASGIIMSPVAISVAESSGPFDRVAVAWRADNTIHYAVSASTGISWSAPIEPSLNTTNAVGLDVAVDELDVVHLAWSTSDFDAGVSHLRYCRASNDGALLSDWGVEQTVVAFDDPGSTPVTLAVDLDGSGGLLAATRDSVLHVFATDDAGVTWSASDVLDGFTDPDAAWGAAGPFIAADTRPQSGLDKGRAILSPDAAVSGPWSAELVMSEPTMARTGCRLALDPTRGGAPMLVSLRAVLGDENEHYRLWFDAAWRDAPGYGVPEPMLPILTEGVEITRAVLPGDVDGDATLELVYTEATSEFVHTLKIWDPDLGAETTSLQLVHPTADIALLDIDGDQKLEILWFSGNGQFVYARNGDSGYVPGYPLELGTDAGWISGAAVTGNDEDDVVVAVDDEVWVLGPDAQPRPGFPWTAPAMAGEVNGRVAIGDVDNDGRLDLVVPFEGGLLLLDRDGVPFSSFGQNEPSPGSPSLHDFDGDGDLEIAYPRADGSVHLVHHDGTPVTAAWPYATGAAGMASQVALANLDAAGNHDLVFTTPDGQLHLVTASGAPVANWPRPVDLGGDVVEAIVAQLGAGGLSAALGEVDGRLRLLEYDGGQEGWSRDQAAPILAPVSAADIDADGVVEMMVPTSQALWVLDMGVAAAGGAWPISGANAGRTGCLATVAATSAPEPIPAALTLRGNHPNPFNPMTVISFRLDADASRASLRIYDVSGRLVRTLVDGALAGGDHEVLWRGRDERGREVASGTYLYRLEADGASRSRSMVLVR